ncbi:nitroreductase family protein [Candidatus Bipolaricaulota bacterium]|nr:nitroreductase family protein [Candidatus Bipolaricaulota bacterium]
MAASEADIVLDVVKKRRSVRSYQDRRVPREMLERTLEAGQWAPSPSNVQSWRFIVVQEPKQLRTLKTLSPGFPKEASAAIVVCSNQRDVQNFAGISRSTLVAEEAAMSVQNMLLAAHALGLGSCAVASFSEGGTKVLLELPEHIYPILLVALGFPRKQPVAPPRKELSQITSWETYQEG